MLRLLTLAGLRGWIGLSGRTCASVVVLGAEFLRRCLKWDPRDEVAWLLPFRTLHDDDDDDDALQH